MNQNSWRTALVLLVSSLTLIGCGGATKNNEAVKPGAEVLCPDGSVNGGKTILTMDCNTVVQFEGNEFEATIDAKYAGAGLHNAPRVLRDIDQAATDAQVQFTQTCRVFNSCQMKSEEFQSQLASTQAQFRSLREKLMLLQASGGDPAALRQVLAETYQVAVPEPERRDKSLAMSLLVQVKDTPSSSPRLLKEGDTLHTGAQVIVGVEVSQDAHVYVFQHHEDKGLDVLFPNPQIQNLPNPLGSGNMVRIPPGGQVFTLNNEDLGEERIYVAVSTRPLNDLQAALGQEGQVGSAPVAQAMSSLFEEGKPECKGEHRGLEVSQEECGSMSRGLELSPQQGDEFFNAPGSRQAQSAPGDDVILESIGFVHVE